MSELYLVIVSDNGAIRELGEILDIPAIGYSVEAESEYVSGYANGVGQKFVVDASDIIPVDGATRLDLFLGIACGLDVDKIKRNNWRKLHNLPVKRRGYHGRRKRNNF